MRYFTPASSATRFLLGKLTSTKNEMVTSSSETKMKMKSIAETKYIKPAQVRSGGEKKWPRLAEGVSSVLLKTGAESTSRTSTVTWTSETTRLTASTKAA